MKQGIRVLGIDDGAFDFEDSSTALTGVVYRGTEFIEDISITKVSVDGEDATEKVLELHEACNNHRQIKAILIDGISFAGFNIVDMEHVSQETGKPVVAVTGNQPDREKFRRIMEKTDNQDEKFDELDDPEELELKDGRVYIQFSGTSAAKARHLIEKSTLHGLTPEPIRVAHMMGKALRHDSVP